MSKRRENDAYYTPAWATQELLKRVCIDGFVIEPCAGEGAIASLFKNDENTVVHPNDIATGGLDATTDGLYQLHEPDWVITNPPFSHAMEILQQAHKHAKVGVAFLLRLSFLEPVYKRGEWLAANPPDYQLVLPRISFTGDGKTDSVTCAWLVWYKDAAYNIRGWHPPTGIEVVPKQRRKVKEAA